MNSLHWLKKSCAVALAGILLTYSGSSFVFADEQSDLADRLEQAQQELEESEQKLDDAQNELENQQKLGSSMRQSEQQLRNEISSLVGQISTTEAQIAAKQEEIDEQQGKIDEQQERIDDRWDDFKERVAAMQVMRSGGMLGMLANVTSLTAFLSFGDDLQQLSKKDREVLDEMNAEKTKLEQLQLELETQRNELETQRVNMQSQQQQLEANKAQLAEQIKEQDKNIDAAAADEQAAQAERDAKYRIWVQAQAEYDRLANQGGGGSVIGDGSVMWPLPGYTRLSSVFGEDRWIWGVADTNHGGVDIPAPAGTPIHVFQSGTVYNSYYSASYGNVVMVDHGGGLVSIYAHMSSRAANVGDVVIVGDVIGYVGSTGQSSGNHLHFETRQNGVRVDPLGYVSPS